MVAPDRTPDGRLRRLSVGLCRAQPDRRRYSRSHADADGVQELRESYLSERRHRPEVQPRPRARRPVAMPRELPEVRASARRRGVDPRDARSAADATRAEQPRRRVGGSAARRGRGHPERGRCTHRAEVEVEQADARPAYEASSGSSSPQTADRGSDRPVGICTIAGSRIPHDVCCCPDSRPDASRPVELPTTDQEIWRYSRIGELDLSRYHPVDHELDVQGREPYRRRRRRDRRPVPGDPPDVFAEHQRRRRQPSPRRRSRPAPWSPSRSSITHTIPGDGRARLPRDCVIDAGDDSEVTVIERFRLGRADGPALVAARAAGAASVQAARVNYLAINELERRGLVDRQPAGRGRARLDHAARDGRARRRLRPGPHRSPSRPAAARRRDRSRCTSPAATQMHDFRTIQDHDAPHTNSDLLFKGAVQDHCRQRVHRA